MNVKKKLSSVQTSETPETYRVYKRRWFTLFIFCSIYFMNSAQGNQYTIIENIIMKYYDISATMVNMTSVVYLILYLPLLLPASYVMNKKGIRFSLILAASGNFIGSWLKVFSTHPNGFYIGLIGQTILSSSQVFLLSMPSKLAGVWFSANQMSTACTIGIFGDQLGTATSFLLTPIVVQDKEDMADIGHELFQLFLIVASMTTVILITTIAFLYDEPPTAPSETHMLKKQENEEHLHILTSYKRLLTNKPFVLLICAYATISGIYNAINTLLNPILLEHFETNGEKFAGSIGAVFIVSGCFSSVAFGIILDKTKKFKYVGIFIFVMSIFGMIAFAFAIVSEVKLLVYISALLLGLFISGCLAVGCETGVELTYPESEFNSSGVLLAVCQTSGGIFTLVFTYLLEKTNTFWTNMGMVLLLVIGTIINLFIDNIRKRQDALNKDKKNSDLYNKLETTRINITVQVISPGVQGIFDVY